jgi:hypothetical protein
MTDVIKTVVALQGNPVKREILGAGQDGYVLTWDNADNEWKAVQAAPRGNGGAPNSGAGGSGTNDGTDNCGNGGSGMLTVAWIA